MESMTGFGRAETAGDGYKVTVEAKSLNHRSLSVSLKLPEVVSAMEPEVRATISGMFDRGRIRLDASVELSVDGGSRVFVNMETARLFIASAELLSRDNESISKISAGELLNLPGVVERVEPSMLDSEELTTAFEASISLALTELRENRRREGAALAPLFRAGFSNIREMTAPVLAQQKESVADRYKRLRLRISDLLDNIKLDNDRLMQELALLADRSDVTEEVQRLLCHLDYAIELVDSDNGPAGRKLEFLIQEMHRELNTMGAKVDDPEQSLKVIEMKNILSSLKEQAANIE
ncbi:MAG: YicC family protein [Candidatus Aegiribacteria sp.]|nr:YicC family protein [Candidatus Aegiribacteria sp.]